MVTGFFAIDGIALLDILPAGAKVIAHCLCENVIGIFTRAACPNGRTAGAIRHVLHFDNALVRNGERVQRKLDECSVRRPEHPPYSPDFAHCDFVLFRYLHEEIQFLLYATVEELEQTITRIIEHITKSQLIRAFRAWRRRFEKCIQQEGNYFE
jgi:hypothetical protein